MCIASLTVASMQEDFHQANQFCHPREATHSLLLSKGFSITETSRAISPGLLHGGLFAVTAQNINSSCPSLPLLQAPYSSAYNFPAPPLVLPCLYDAHSCRRRESGADYSSCPYQTYFPGKCGVV